MIHNLFNKCARYKILLKVKPVRDLRHVTNTKDLQLIFIDTHIQSDELYIKSKWMEILHYKLSLNKGERGDIKRRRLFPCIQYQVS